VFSNFHLTREMAVEYARIMREKQVRIFHSYPSAAVDFARHLQESGERKPDFKVVLLGSENLYPGQREFVQEFFGCRVFTWMGHSENVVLAGGCEQSDNYHVFPEYGFVELLDGDSAVMDEGRQGELVGTTLYNYAMPLIRYRTGDWAVAGPKACVCGRKHRLLSWVYGRRDQELLIGKAGNRISFTAINMHGRLYDNVERFQFYQKQPGEADLRIVRRPSYTDADSRLILKEMNDKMADSILLRLHFVDAIEQTERGKFRFIVQECGNANAQQA
jgi:phenylacetate-CoA ligase